MEDVTYTVGDKVIHPAYGAGVVTKVVRRSIGGSDRRYYLIVPLALDDTEIMVPVDHVARVGLRNAVGSREMARALTTLQGPPTQLASDYGERQQRVKEKIESRDPTRLAEVARDLAAFRRLKRGRIGSEDLRLLKRSREYLAGELALVESLSFDAALSRIDESLMLSGETLQPRI